MLTRITYTSVRAPAFSDAQVIADLVRPSLARNTLAGISSCLWFGPGCFVQVIEGPSKQVDALMARITADQRHSKVQIVSRSQAVVRLFDGWPLKTVDAARCPTVGPLANAMVDKRSAGHPPLDLRLMAGPTLTIDVSHHNPEPLQSSPLRNLIDLLGELKMAAPLVY